MTLADTLREMEASLMDDGRISLGETTLLLRVARPYAARGDVAARTLMQLLQRVRADGVVTPAESAEVCSLLGRIVTEELKLEDFVQEVPAPSRPASRFYDLTPLLASPVAFQLAIRRLAALLEGVNFDFVVAPESRGFIFGSALAAHLGAGFLPVCHHGKLPRRTVEQPCANSEGRVMLQLHADAPVRGKGVVVIDDLLATGATALATAKVVERLGGQVVKMVFPVELTDCCAREHVLAGYDVASLMRYGGRQ